MLQHAQQLGLAVHVGPDVRLQAVVLPELLLRCEISNFRIFSASTAAHIVAHASVLFAAVWLRVRLHCILRQSCYGPTVLATKPSPLGCNRPRNPWTDGVFCKTA